MKTTSRWILPLLLLVGSAAYADAGLQSFVDQTLTEVRTRANLPAVVRIYRVEGS